MKHAHALLACQSGPKNCVVFSIAWKFLLPTSSHTVMPLWYSSSSPHALLSVVAHSSSSRKEPIIRSLHTPLSGSYTKSLYAYPLNTSCLPGSYVALSSTTSLLPALLLLRHGLYHACLVT